MEKNHSSSCSIFKMLKTMKTKLLLFLLVAALAVPMMQAQLKTDELKAAAEHLTCINTHKAEPIIAATSQYCQAPIVTYEFTGVEEVTVTITNPEAGATVYYEINRSLSLFNEDEFVDSGSFTGNQYSYVVTGGGYLYSVTAHTQKSGMSNSPEYIVLFTIDEVVAPVEQCVSPSVAYQVTGYDQVALTFTNNESGSRVYYEIYRDGSKIYQSSFTGSSYNYYVNGGGDYEARAYSKKSGKDDSTVSGVLFTIVEDVAPLDKCLSPNFTYQQTGYETMTVTINNLEEGSTVYYYVYKGSTLYTQSSFTGSSFQFNIDGDGSYRVKAVSKRSGMEDSNMSGVYFHLGSSSSTCLAPIASYQVTGVEAVTVTVQNRESGATVYYYVYESNDMIDSGTFTGEQYDFIVNGAGEYDVYAVAKKSGMSNSYQAGVLFTIDDQVAPMEQCAAPYVSQQQIGVETVTLTFTNNESGSRVYYEIYRDGSKIYQSSFTGSSYNYIVTGGGDYVVRAYSKMSGMVDSPVSGVLFTIVEEEAPVDKPLAPMVSYQYTGYETVTVTITNRDPDATVQYGVSDLSGNTDDFTGSFTGDSYSFNITGAGEYLVLAAAVINDVYSSLAGARITIEGQQTPAEHGDVDGNGVIGMDDLTALINYLVYGTTNGISMTGADVDGNGVIGMDDLTALINYLVYGQWPAQTFTVNGVSFKMVPVEGGTFTMGYDGSGALSNEYPVHQVTVTSYSIGETEVTQALWQAVMGSNPSEFTGDLNRPVEKVTWYDCQTFITKLNQMTGQQFRLPTEAEWEFAARGGKKSHGYTYAGSNTLNDVAWNQNNSSSQSHPVATKAPNELGLYDMSGNVFEWVQDWSSSYSSEAQVNPTGPATGENKMIRGGSHSYPTYSCRVSCRLSDAPTNKWNDQGLRLAL